MKYEVNFGGLDFSQGITVDEIYVGNDTNRISSTNKPTFKTLEELATICYIYGITVVEVPSPVVRNLLIFNSSADLVGNVSGSKKFMKVTCGGVDYDITPDGVMPYASANGVVSVTVSAAGTGYIAPPTVTASAGDATFAAKLKAISGTVTAGGSGYAVDDVITLSNGVKVKVATLSTTAVATVTIEDGGSLTGTMATNPVAQDSTTGSGTDATITLTYGVESVGVTVGGSYETAPTLSFSGVLEVGLLVLRF